MSEKLVVTETKSNEIQTVFSNETIELIKNTVAPKNITAKEFEMFIYQAKRTGLDPLSRQIYCIKTTGKSGDKLSIQATIDGFRLIAERTGDYQGQTPVMWCGDDGIWKDVWLGKVLPSAAKVGVNRKGFIEPLYAIAKFDTYAQRYQDGNLYFIWSKMPDLMIAKCAEALALRKAFPQELSNIYSTEEMANFTEENNVTVVKSEPVKSEKLFNEIVTDFMKTIISREALERAYDRAKKNAQYNALTDEQKANIDEVYLDCISKFIKTEKPRGELNGDMGNEFNEVFAKENIPFDIPAEDVKTVEVVSDELSEIAELKACKNVTDLNKVYKKIISVPTYKQYAGEYQEEIDSVFESCKEQIKTKAK